MIPENTYKALAEESYQEKSKVGLTALNCTVIRVPIGSDKAVRNLMRVCGRNVPVNAILTQQQGREYSTVHMAMAEITTTKSKRCRIQCVHVAVETFT